jgi:hypothetical protein
MVISILMYSSVGFWEKMVEQTYKGIGPEDKYDAPLSHHLYQITSLSVVSDNPPLFENLGHILPTW